MKIHDPWKRLAEAAKRHRMVDEPLAAMPFGFDTRVLAQVRPPRRLAAELWGRLAIEAVPVAAGALLVCWLTIQPPTEAAVMDVAALADRLYEEAFQP